MPNAEISELYAITKQLEAVIEKNNDSEISASFKIIDGDKTMCLSSNRDGLTYFASVFLRLALSDFDGAHQHFDENTILDECDRELIIRFMDNK